MMQNTQEQIEERKINISRSVSGVASRKWKRDWASEASPTLGCSIEISRDICIGYITR